MEFGTTAVAAAHLLKECCLKEDEEVTEPFYGHPSKGLLLILVMLLVSVVGDYYH